MNSKTKKILLLALAQILFIIILPTLVSAATDTQTLTYVPLEEIPGFGRNSSLPDYIMSIYKFGLISIGVSAVFMITIGGFMYITSAGNSSSATNAKKYISDAIAGVILAMISYLLLYIINPGLLSMTASTQIGAAGTPGTVGGPGGTSAGYKKACSNSSATTINYNDAANDGDIKPAKACDNYNFSGANAKILKAMAQLESSCGSNKGPSSSGACGLMQILPSTATELAGRNVTCEELNRDDNLSIQLADKYVTKNLSSDCVKNSSNPTAAIFAGYNSGYGCGTAACSPKLHSLCPSNDCPGGMAYQCCKNPGGLQESINYAWNGMGLYSKLP